MERRSMERPRRPASSAPRVNRGSGYQGRNSKPYGSPIQKVQEVISPLKTQNTDENLRFVALGGLDEVGRNCSFFEYKNEIVVVDVGIQFPEEETPGIDYIIPKVTYLEPKKQNIRGIIFTHGHYDHIHALPYLLEKLGNPIIYTALFTKQMIEKRCEEFPNIPKPKFQVVKDGDVIKLSENFSAEFFAISHTIPDGLGFILNTVAGKIAHFGDFRLETDKSGKPINLGAFDRLAKLDIHSIFVDSTNAFKDGFSISERIVEENLEQLFKGAKQRLIVTCFSSLVDRIIEMFKIADKLGRKIALNGRSMKDNVQIAQSIGYLKPGKGQLIALEEANNYPDNKVMILTAGAQGEANSGFMRIVNGEHRIISLKKTDTVIFSSSVIPGNERSVQALQDNVSRQVDELYNTKLLDIHSSGHACSEDLKLVIDIIKPKFVIPVHAYYFMRKHVKHLAKEVGYNPDQVVILENGQVAHLTKDGFDITKENVPTSYVMVDGSGIGDVEEVVLRDRLALAEEGMIVIIVTIDKMTGRMLKNPDIISRGFIYLKENKELLDEMRRKLRIIIEKMPNQETDPDYLKMMMREQVGQFVYQKTKRRPMVLPVMIEV